MVIKINGKCEEIGKCLKLDSLIKKRKLSPAKIVVEYNFCVVPKEKWSKITLKDKDSLEIISFVGGG